MSQCGSAAPGLAAAGRLLPVLNVGGLGNLKSSEPELPELLWSHTLLGVLSMAVGSNKAVLTSAQVTTALGQLPAWPSCEQLRKA